MDRLLLSVCGSVLLFASTGCGERDKNLESPEAFIEKYGRELFMARYGDDMAAMGCDRIDLAGHAVGIDQYRGEYVSASLSIIPKSGITYHRRVAAFDSARRLMAFSVPYGLSRHVGDEMSTAIAKKASNLYKYLPQPVVYEPEPVDMTPKLSPACVIRVYRAKDGAGAYHPVSGRGLEALEFYDTDNKYKMTSLASFNSGVGGVVSSDMIKLHNGMAAGSKAAVEAANAYSNSIVAANACFARLKNACDAIDGLETKSRSEYFWVWQKVNAAEKSLSSAVRAAEEHAYMVKTNGKGGINRLSASLNNAKNRVAMAQKARQSATANLERQNANIAVASARKNIGASVIERMRRQADRCAARIAEAEAAEKSAADDVIRLESELETAKTTHQSAVKESDAAIIAAKERRTSELEAVEKQAKKEHAALLASAKEEVVKAAADTLSALSRIGH